MSILACTNRIYRETSTVDVIPMKNIAYQTDRLAQYFSHNRVTWAQFYQSERAIFEQLGLERHQQILDVGCGCGGLGLALRERFGTEHYTGVEINSLSAEVARAMNPQGEFLTGDILDLCETALRDRFFDIVVSLSCVDWNVQFSEMLAATWSRVLPGGYLVSTFRLTTEEGCADFKRSHQFINFDGVREGERASYVVFNASSLIAVLRGLHPSEMHAYGYWGLPSASAVTPYARLCFSAFAIRKRATDDVEPIRHSLTLPVEILDTTALF